MTPKEEPKQECPHPEPRKDYYRDGCFKCWQCGKIVVEHNNYKQETLEQKQETLEEAAERFYPPKTTDLICSPKLVRDAFKEGAKWQQERMYSDMQEYAEFCIRCYEKGMPCIIAEDWFEQFKKK